MNYHFELSAEFAQQLDLQDPLAGFRHRFHFPTHNGKEVIYFCGNSLGLQPVSADAAIETELKNWRELAVGGYFGGTNPWLYYHDYCKPALTTLMGCKPEEVTVMNTLTLNLHLALFSFYRPSPKRFRIIMEAGAFPSDQYAIESQVRHFGSFPGMEHIRPETAIVEIAPRSGEKLLRPEDILDAIRLQGSELALVLFGGINYYTGQVYDMQAITAAAHEAGAIAGFDLAHVAGNMPVQLHDWQVDFAVWCSYKYLNAGPGAVGGLFIHENHISNTELNRMAGWWGNDEKVRFRMEKGFVPKPDVNGWCVSTSQVFNTVCLKASLAIFAEAGIKNIRAKSRMLTSYLEYLLAHTALKCEIITPSDPDQRGAQLSLYFSENGRAIHDKMLENGIIVDYREPGVIRLAPAPLYCGFSDVYRFYELLLLMTGS